MPLQIDELEIEDRHLTSLTIDAISGNLFFRGTALDDEGQKICLRLSQIKAGTIVEVTAEYHSVGRFQGLYEILDVTIPPREERERIIYRFSGVMRPVR